jgi:DNA invertase Pin-like site-specific DNA recombinase
MKIGYCRISTGDQNLDLQKDALFGAGCGRVFQDIASGARDDRPGLREALEFARPGDTIVVWRLDRLGRSLQHLIQVINDLTAKEVGFQSVTESIDTATPGGRLVLHIFGALAQFERDLIRARTTAGLAAAKQRGRLGGRPRILDEKQISMAREILKDPAAQVKEVSKLLGVSRSALYRYLAPSEE